jgi:hypothetical protein
VAGSGEIIGGNLADWPETEQLFRHRADTIESERASENTKQDGGGAAPPRVSARRRHFRGLGHVIIRAVYNSGAAGAAGGLPPR